VVSIVEPVRPESRLLPELDEESAPNRVLRSAVCSFTRSVFNCLVAAVCAAVSPDEAAFAIALRSTVTASFAELSAAGAVELELRSEVEPELVLLMPSSEFSEAADVSELIEDKLMKRLSTVGAHLFSTISFNFRGSIRKRLTPCATPAFGWLIMLIGGSMRSLFSTIDPQQTITERLPATGHFSFTIRLHLMCSRYNLGRRDIQNGKRRFGR
jgi:hypothetical protein